MRLTRVGDNHGYACTVDGFGGGDFETAGAFHHDECDVVFFKVFDGMGDPFGVVGFGFLVLDKDETEMTKFRLAMSMPA